MSDLINAKEYLKLKQNLAVLQKAEDAVEAALKRDDFPKLKDACQVWASAAAKLGGGGRIADLKNAFAALEQSEKAIKSAMATNDLGRLTAACHGNRQVAEAFGRALEAVKGKFHL